MPDQRGSAPFDADEPLEGWESPESRRERYAWKGELSREATDAGTSPLPGAPALDSDALRQLAHVASQQAAQMLFMQQLARQVARLNREMVELKASRVSETKAPVTARPETVSSFISGHDLAPTINALIAAAANVFGSNRIEVMPQLGYDNDLGGEFLRVVVHVDVSDRSEFRKLKREFDAVVEGLPNGDDGLARLVVTISRRA